MGNFKWIILLLAFSNCMTAQEARNAAEARIRVRDGFTLTVAESSIKRPRFMQFGKDGELYVSLPGDGIIKSCRDKDGDGFFETVTNFVTGHNLVHGMCYHEGWLWFAESGAIFKARDTNGDGKADEKKTVIAKGAIPGSGGHWWRSLLIHNNRIFTSIGDSGNITDEGETERQKIFSFDLDGSGKKQFCSGIRNTEKLVVRPGTDEIWGMDHGSDWFGRELEGEQFPDGQPITDFNPPCEMNHYVQGGFYGHPFVVGNKVPRYEYMNRKDIVKLAASTIPPAWAAGAHWAPNSMTFYTGSQFPDNHRGDAFVSYHGSWNRTTKGGYCVTRVFFDQGLPYGELKYVNFLSEKDEILGRPVDTAVAPDGSLLISDDYGNKIYRLSYTAGKSK